MDFGGFIKELNKAIKKENRSRRKADQSEIAKLTKKDEFDWMDLFEERKQKAVQLLQKITQTEQEIDQMVYELYVLTEEEIQTLKIS
ncbi:MAG TPA: hypothetical protein ENH91_15705 [Leeuwenhoekiella sp.]|nr:hypothetical protein [Leeuwenhoekiella sp.]